jgi:hypothetical protein
VAGPVGPPPIRKAAVSIAMLSFRVIRLSVLSTLVRSLPVSPSPTQRTGMGCLKLAQSCFFGCRGGLTGDPGVRRPIYERGRSPAPGPTCSDGGSTGQMKFARAAAEGHPLIASEPWRRAPHQEGNTAES